MSFIFHSFHKSDGIIFIFLDFRVSDFIHPQVFLFTHNFIVENTFGILYTDPGTSSLAKPELLSCMRGEKTAF
jgi:hypothetical protein